MESGHENAIPTTHSLCADCGNSVATSWHSHTFQYGSGTSAADLTVRLPVRRCDHCDFDYLDDEGERIKHEAVCRHLGVLTPAEVRGIREHHGMSRAAFAKITGIGEASLGRWENGINVQAPANDRYLRLLARPGILTQLQGMIGQPPQEASRSTFRRIKITAATLQRKQSFSLRGTPPPLAA